MHRQKTYAEETIAKERVQCGVCGRMIEPNSKCYHQLYEGKLVYYCLDCGFYWTKKDTPNALEIRGRF